MALDMHNFGEYCYLANESAQGGGENCLSSRNQDSKPIFNLTALTAFFNH